MDRLAGWSSRLHAEWAERLRTETGTDVEYWTCGGVYLARSTGEVAALAGLTEAWRDEQIPFEILDESTLRARLGRQFRSASHPQLAVFNPIEAQIRNPYFLKTLRMAIELRGGKLIENAGAIRLEAQAGRIARIHSESAGVIEPDQVCIAAGAWSYELLQTAGINLPVEPVRGQMVLFKLPELPFECIVNEGSRYLVPRQDGYVLAGSTMEQVGFDCSTTEPEIDELIAFAESLFPILNRGNVVNQWAGLRPASYDGLPYIGRLPGLSNAVVATGHLRSGLQLAPATANLIADLFAGIESHELLTLLNRGRVSHH